MADEDNDTVTRLVVLAALRDHARETNGSARRATWLAIAAALVPLLAASWVVASYLFTTDKSAQATYSRIDRTDALQDLRIEATDKKLDVLQHDVRAIGRKVGARMTTDDE